MTLDDARTRRDRDGMERALLTMVVIAAAGALGITAALSGLAGEKVATTLAMGIAVGTAVYADRKWLRPAPRAITRALEYGGATALGWALAQVIIGLS